MVENNSNKYLAQLKKWSGYQLNPMEDFDVICQSDLDFLELLVIWEKKFSVNMLDHSKSKEDFSTIHEFIGWASANPPVTKYIK